MASSHTVTDPAHADVADTVLATEALSETISPEESSPETELAREAPLEEAAAGVAGPRDPRWWGDVGLAMGQVACLLAGPSTVHLQRLAAEWRVWQAQDEDPYAAAAQRAELRDEPPEAAPSGRFAFSRAPETVSVRPALADRPVVVRPDGALAIGAGQTVTFFVSTPTWVTVIVPDGKDPKVPARLEDVLWEAPTHRPSDTWFGTSTREGELCYAVRTAGRLSVSELPLRPHRAVTPLTIVNEAAIPLVLTRIQVPLPQLALHVDRDGRLWTDGARFTRQADGDDAALRVVPAKLGGGSRLAPPRAPVAPNVVLKAFSRFFRGDGP